MCLAPFVLGIVPLAVFLVSPADQLALSGFMFGLSIMGMVSPYPDVYNALLLLRHARGSDHIMFFEDGMYRIAG